MSTVIRNICTDPARMAAEFAKRPGSKAKMTFDRIEAGPFSRRDIRAAFDMARVRGAVVDVREAKGWLESVFTGRLEGTEDQLMPTVRALAALVAWQ